MPVRLGVTAALAAATAAGATMPKDSTVKTGAGVLGSLATAGYAWWAFKETAGEDKKALTAAGVGVGATALVATAMYFLGGREAPKVPSLDELSTFGKREFLFGALSSTSMEDLPETIRREYYVKRPGLPDGIGSHLNCSAVSDSDTGDIIVACKNMSNGTSWKDHWKCHTDSGGNRSYSLEGPYES